LDPEAIGWTLLLEHNNCPVLAYLCLPLYFFFQESSMGEAGQFVYALIDDLRFAFASELII
jgi:hypothetical protein